MAIETAPFGSTGHHSTRIIFGAAALWAMRQERADELLAKLLAHGINHIDTAASYGDAELRLGAWMRRHRERFFLASKTGARDYAGAKQSIERSLQLLQTDRLDLLQLHNLVAVDEWEQALAPGGALQAVVEARAAGLVRFIGVTGHGTRVAAMHLRSLERFPFDSVLLPYNFTMMSQPEYAADFERLYEVCRARGVALQTIKAVARRRWQDDGARHFSWYEPLRDADALRRSVHWVLARPGVFLSSSSDAALLDTILAAASAAGPEPAAAAMRADVERFAMQPLFTPGALDEI